MLVNKREPYTLRFNLLSSSCGLVGGAGFLCDYGGCWTEPAFCAPALCAISLPWRCLSSSLSPSSGGLLPGTHTKSGNWTGMPAWMDALISPGRGLFLPAETRRRWDVFACCVRVRERRTLLYYLY